MTGVGSSSIVSVLSFRYGRLNLALPLRPRTLAADIDLERRNEPACQSETARL
jgi:hypothetical protein